MRVVCMFCTNECFMLLAAWFCSSFKLIQRTMFPNELFIDIDCECTEWEQIGSGACDICTIDKEIGGRIWSRWNGIHTRGDSKNKNPSCMYKCPLHVIIIHLCLLLYKLSCEHGTYACFQMEKKNMGPCFPLPTVKGSGRKCGKLHSFPSMLSSMKSYTVSISLDMGEKGAKNTKLTKRLRKSFQ